MGLTNMIGKLRKEIKDGKPRKKNATAYSEEALAAKRTLLDQLVAKRAKQSAENAVSKVTAHTSTETTRGIKAVNKHTTDEIGQVLTAIGDARDKIMSPFVPVTGSKQSQLQARQRMILELQKESNKLREEIAEEKKDAQKAKAAEKAAAEKAQLFFFGFRD